MTEKQKVYVATSGEYSDYGIEAVFANEEDAKNYGLADGYVEMEVHEGPIETRLWHTYTWRPCYPPVSEWGIPNPEFGYSKRRVFDGDPTKVVHSWLGRRVREYENGDRFITLPGDLELEVEGWDKDLILKVYSEQRAKYLSELNEPQPEGPKSPKKYPNKKTNSTYNKKDTN